MLFWRLKAIWLAGLLLAGMEMSLVSACWAATPAANWMLRDMTGHVHQLSHYRGQWVVVNYWAPWCPPCLEEMPELVTFYDAYAKKQVVVLGVAVQYENEQSVKKFVEDMLVSYPIVLGEAQSNKAIMRPEVLPTTYIYAPDGSLYKVKRGTLSKQWLETLLKEAAPALK